MAFAVLKDAVRTTVASYTLGSGSLTVATGQGSQFPVPTALAPILVTVITAASYASYPETFCTYQATGITSDTLTGLTVIDGVDTPWAVGAIVEMRTCAKHINDLESALAGVTEVSQTTSFSAAAGAFYAITGSSAVTATLPTAVGIAGQPIRIRCANGYSGLCTLATTSSQTIGPGTATSQILYAGESPLLQSDGANWVRTGGTIIPCRAVMFSNANQSIPATTNTQVTINAKYIDNTGIIGSGSNLTSNQITVFRSGIYNIRGVIPFNLPAGTAIITGVPQIAVNGSTIFQNFFSFPEIAGTPGNGAFFVYENFQLSAGDVVTLVAECSIALTILGNATYPGSNAACCLDVAEIPAW